MERRMKTVENGKDHLICIESIFFPNVQAVAGSGKAEERERERERVGLMAGQLTASLNYHSARR